MQEDDGDPTKKRSDARYMPLPDRLRIYAESGGFCSFPACEELLVQDETWETLNSGQIAHIRGRETEAARHDPEYPPELLDSYENTILLCYKHHHKIDSSQTRGDYPTAIVESMKVAASTKFTDFRRSGLSAPSFELIDELCKGVAGRVIDPNEDYDRVKTDRKIIINDLPQEIGALIRRDLSQRRVVSDYLEIKSRQDATFPERVQASIKARYNDLIAQGLGKSATFKIMVVAVRGPDATVEKTNAAQVIVAFFFEMCDIFDKT